MNAFSDILIASAMLYYVNIRPCSFALDCPELTLDRITVVDQKTERDGWLSPQPCLGKGDQIDHRDQYLDE
jgi:hypothetical protein